MGMLFAAGVAFLTPLHAQTRESSVKVMSYNIYRGGKMRGQPLSQTAKVKELFDVHPQYYGWSRLICFQQRSARAGRNRGRELIIGR